MNELDRRLLEARGVDATQQRQLDELGLTDFVLDAVRGNMVNCRAVSCRFQQRGKCTTPPPKLTLNQLWECSVYQPKKRSKD